MDIDKIKQNLITLGYTDITHKYTRYWQDAILKNENLDSFVVSFTDSGEVLSIDFYLWNPVRPKMIESFTLKDFDKKYQSIIRDIKLEELC
jgi:hypothetical protein